MEEDEDEDFFESLFGKPEDHYDAGERVIEKIDVGWAKAALFFRTGQHFGHHARSYKARGLLSLHKTLEIYRFRFEQGNTLSLLNAIALCADENVPLPTWLAIAFRAALDSFLLPGQNTSLDDVFKSENLPTGTSAKAAAARVDWQLGGSIWDEVWDVAMGDESISSLDMAVIAALKRRDFGVKKTKAKALFKMIDKNQSELLQSKSFSRFLELRRKRVTTK